MSPQGKDRTGEKQVRALCCPQRTRKDGMGGGGGKTQTEDAGRRRRSVTVRTGRCQEAREGGGEDTIRRSAGHWKAQQMGRE